jgi:hypothetical protein
METFLTFTLQNIEETKQIGLNNQALQAVEDGKVLFFPNLKFNLTVEEEKFLQPNSLDLKVKSVKYNHANQKIWGFEDKTQNEIIKNLMQRYNEFSINLIKNIFPFYQNSLEIGNTSFRPIEAEGRTQSKRHDDTRLHVDAFPSRPMAGKRLLRIFANINTEGKPRIWNVGEEFETVASRFIPKISPPIPFSAYLMKMFKITKSIRTRYDHYMLNLHDKMKLDEEYQKNTQKETLELNAGSVWVCFSDKVSHAVISGRGLLEQTIYLEPTKMLDQSKSPFHILQKITKQKLI